MQGWQRYLSTIGGRLEIVAAFGDKKIVVTGVQAGSSGLSAAHSLAGFVIGHKAVAADGAEAAPLLNGRSLDGPAELKWQPKFHSSRWSTRSQSRLMSEEVLDAIHGSGAFRTFKSTIRRQGARAILWIG
jgi:hypothetical protein